MPISVTLTAGSPVAGTQNDIAFAPEAPIAAAPSGRPDRTANPAIGKEHTAFWFPTSCASNRAPGM